VNNIPNLDQMDRTLRRRNSRFKTILVTLAALFGAFFFAPAQPADAYTGCQSMVRTQSETWHWTLLYNYPKGMSLPALALAGDVGGSARLFYLYCPNGDRHNKISPESLEFCWHNPDDHFWFDGVTFNAHIFGDTGVMGWDPRPHKVADDGTDKNCSMVFAVEDHWIRLTQGPVWTVTGTVNVRVWDDQEWPFWYRRDKEKDIFVSQATWHGPWHL
jgi:hypothetical protein